MNASRFKGHYLLHDRGAPEEVVRLATIMAQKVDVDFELFKRPNPPYQYKEDASALESYQWLRKNLLPEVPNGSVIFGIGLGGLLAARLQEDFPAKSLAVVAINAPTTEGQITLTNPSFGRVAIYSSAYPPISNYCNWTPLSPQAYDAPWLVHGLKNAMFGLSYLLTAYMQKENIANEIADFNTAAPEVSKGKGAV